MERRLQIPIVDLFSGCGGFSEGFVNKKFGDLGFRLALAIDNDARAHETHLLRNVFHQFDEAPREYYQLLRGEITLDEFYENYPREFKFAQETTLSTLGEGEVKTVTFTVLLKKHSQAQVTGLWSAAPLPSIFKRWQIRSQGKRDSDNDQRHVLYREYLKVIAEFWPSVFVMENVPGVFSAKFKGKRLARYSADLTDPISALGMEGRTVDFDGYRLYLWWQKTVERIFWRYDTE